ncbi:hypothetical protein SPRG_19345 [Saprolegnia parasitica CBS 223.65]|uniref:BAR domain-containing protein n=1 Tax=Saprolegnia parasitica (strain CBS 223.65) TaxID=695850 RepID=A0A067CST4_SAPPC|nr:hypothetical protein SPRG_19345 [Saprolegnia parasitica CBS 223.65]KDO33739.1 hypothetical protein SPRG_19345 [Saprolegnia parasitica CBS 223.65]|eukprot:XP_012195754.1 hypothetical protein SPRG_19345 [Saprolegnia parasitica CBS 223.65]
MSALDSSALASAAEVVPPCVSRSLWSSGRDGVRRWRQKVIFNRFAPSMDRVHNDAEFTLRKKRFDEHLSHMRTLEAQFSTLVNKTMEFGDALASIGKDDAAIKQDGDRSTNQRLEAVQSATIAFRTAMEGSAVLHLQEKVAAMTSTFKEPLHHRAQLELDFHRASRRYANAKQRNKLLEVTLAKQELEAAYRALTVVTETLVVQFRNLEENRVQSTSEELAEVQHRLGDLFADMSALTTHEKQPDATHYLL